MSYLELTGWNLAPKVHGLETARQENKTRSHRMTKVDLDTGMKNRVPTVWFWNTTRPSLPQHGTHSMCTGDGLCPHDASPKCGVSKV